MRLFLVIKRSSLGAGLAACALFSCSLAHAQVTPSASASIQQMQAMANALSGGDYAGGAAPPPSPKPPVSKASPKGSSGESSSLNTVPPPKKPASEQSQEDYDKALADRESPQYQAELLAKRAARERNMRKVVDGIVTRDDETPPPPEDVQSLQSLGEGQRAYLGLEEAADDPLKDEAKAAIDLRRDAQKEAALSFGARGGLAKRNFEIMENVNGFEATLDRVFDFRALLVKAPSGLLIEPPIVRESIDSLVIKQDGNEAAVADRIYDMNKQAKIVTAPRDWRVYLIQPWATKVPRPPRILWPKNEQERSRWAQWVADGFEMGVQQADEMFELNLARLVSEYTGMVRYRLLLAQGMVSQPYALHEDRGVTGTKTLMRVGDRALRITGPSQFLTGSELWKPADR